MSGKKLVPIANSEIKVVESGLTHREEAALRMHLEAREPQLSPSLQAELFSLYLNGLSCEDIQKHNKNLRLGAIVRAARDGDWHNKRLDYVQGLLNGVRDQAQQTQAESVVFVSRGLAMVEKLYGARIHRFLQTGNEEDLGDLKNWGLSQYKTLIELFLKLTGQDSTKRVGVSVTGGITHGGKVQHEGVDPSRPMIGPPSSDDAAKILELLQTIR